MQVQKHNCWIKMLHISVSAAVYLSGMLNHLDRKKGSQYIQCAILLKEYLECCQEST